MWLFKNRTEAGQKLARVLARREFEDPVLLALPRGGVVLAYEVAKALHLPMDVVVSRKIGAPGQPEYGIGAISEDMIPLFSPASEFDFDLEGSLVTQIVEEEKVEIERRVKFFRQGRHLISLNNKTVIIIDDGIATGVTAAAAGRFIRKLKARKVILAVPVGPVEISDFVREHFDEIICINRLENFRGVGMWYKDFTQVEDDEVLKLLLISSK